MKVLLFVKTWISSSRQLYYVILGFRVCEFEVDQIVHIGTEEKSFRISSSRQQNYVLGFRVCELEMRRTHKLRSPN